MRPYYAYPELIRGILIVCLLKRDATFAELTTIAYERKFIRLPRFTAFYFACTFRHSSYALFLTVYIFQCILLARRSPLSRAFSRLSPCGTISYEITFHRQAHFPTISHRQAIQLSRCKMAQKNRHWRRVYKRLLQ